MKSNEIVRELMEKNGIKRADKAMALARALHCTVEDIY